MTVSRKAAAIALGTVLTLAAGGAAVASQHSSGHEAKAGRVVHACVTPKHVTLIGRACHPGEHRVSWNRRGRPGPAGPQGPAGPAGLANIHQSVGVDLNLAVGDSQPVAATCVTGQAIGGAWTDATPNAIVVPTESQVKDNNTWQFTFFNATAQPQRITAYAVCAG